MIKFEIKFIFILIDNTNSKFNDNNLYNVSLFFDVILTIKCINLLRELSQIIYQYTPQILSVHFFSIESYALIIVLIVH